MFIHNFKYTSKILLKNKILIFWTFAFPIILGTFFNMAFSSIEKKEKLDIIDIAIILNDGFNNNILQESFEKLSDKDNSERLFNIKYVDENSAIKLLNDGKISGYINFSDIPKIVVKSNGINETIIKYVTDEIIQNSNIIEDITEIKVQMELGLSNFNIDYEKIYSDTLSLVENKKDNIKDISSNKLSYIMVEYYTLIALACLYGGILAMFVVSKSLANMTSTGKRIHISMAKKKTIIFSGVLASLMIQLVGIIILFIYTIFVLKVDYGNDLPLIMLLSFVGCIAGTSLGTIITTYIKSNENLKMGIIITITTLYCFLSGMMGVTMKYIIDKNIPIINKINPANMITDGFYSLYYYDTYDRYYFNIVSLLIFSSFCLIISSFSLRRQKYDSI